MTTADVMTTQDVAKRFYALAKESNWHQILDELYSTDAKSIEPSHSKDLPSASGLDNLKAKGKQWDSMIEESHGGFCTEPLVAGNYFTCTMGADLTMKDQGRVTMEEVAVYEVKDGKIVCEQFFF
jgi:hypothetical protein